MLPEYSGPLAFLRPHIMAIASRLSTLAGRMHGTECQFSFQQLPSLVADRPWVLDGVVTTPSGRKERVRRPHRSAWSIQTMTPSHLSKHFFRAVRTSAGASAIVAIPCSSWFWQSCIASSFPDPPVKRVMASPCCTYTCICTLNCSCQPRDPESIPIRLLACSCLPDSPIQDPYPAESRAGRGGAFLPTHKSTNGIKLRQK